MRKKKCYAELNKRIEVQYNAARYHVESEKIDKTRLKGQEKYRKYRQEKIQLKNR